MYIDGKRGVVRLPAVDVALQVGWERCVCTPDKVKAAWDGRDRGVEGAVLVGAATMELDGNLDGGEEEQQRAGQHVEVAVAGCVHPACVVHLSWTVSLLRASSRPWYLGLATKEGGAHGSSLTAGAGRGGHVVVMYTRA